MSKGGGFVAGSIIGKLLMDKTGWDSSIKAVDKDTKTLGDKLGQLGTKFSAVGKSLGTVGGAVVGTLGAIVKVAADAGDKINDLAQRTGIATEILSGYKLAADKSGTSLEGFATGMRGLSNVMAAANGGSKEAVGLFDSLGVSFKNADGSLRPLNDVFLDVADRLSKMPDGAQKTALAMDAFGRSGMDLIPMLNMGRDGLQENYDITKKLGGIWSKEGAQAADKFNDSLAELKTAMGGLGKEIGMALMPMVKDFIEKAGDTIANVSAWAKEHPGLTQAISGTGLALGGLATGMGTFIMIAGTMVTKIVAIASALSMSAGALTALLGVWGAAATAVAFLAGKYIDLGNAENYAIKAGQTLREVQMNLVDKLSAAASAADWQFGRMSKLIDAYDGNIAALAMAIEKGKEGKDIQEALANVGKKHAEALDKQKASTLGFVGAAKSLNETLGITLRSDTTQRIEQLKKALVEYRGNLTADEIWKINTEIQSLSQQLKGLTPNAADAAQAIGGMIDQALSGLNEIDADKVNVEWDDMLDASNKWMTGTVSNIKQIPQEFKTSTKESRDYFAGLMNDIAQGFGNTIQEWLSGATTFKDFMTGLWGDIKDAFFTVIGEMVAEWTVNFVKKLISDAADVGTSIAKNVGGALSGVGSAAGSMAGSFLTAASSVASIVTAVASVISLFKKAPTGAGDGMGRVVERQDQQTSLLTSIKDFCLNDIHVGLLNLGRIMDSVTAGGWSNNWLKKIDANISDMKGVLSGVTGAANGAVLTSPQLVMTHGTSTNPEWILRQRQIDTMGSARGQSPTIININLNGEIITDREAVRKRFLPQIAEAVEAGLMKNRLQNALLGGQ